MYLTLLPHQRVWNTRIRTTCTNSSVIPWRASVLSKLSHTLHARTARRLPELLPGSPPPPPPLPPDRRNYTHTHTHTQRAHAARTTLALPNGQVLCPHCLSHTPSIRLHSPEADENFGKSTDIVHRLRVHDNLVYHQTLHTALIFWSTAEKTNDYSKIALEDNGRRSRQFMHLTQSLNFLPKSFSCSPRGLTFTWWGCWFFFFT